MDRAELSRIAHTDHPIAAPVSPASVRRLLAGLDPSAGGRVVDLGCGAGAWLLALLAARGDLTAVGVDTALHPERDARAVASGVADRVLWVEADAATWQPEDERTGGGHADERGTASDAVICIGTSHAFGGLDGTLDAMRRHLRPGGRALLGDAIWEQPPSSAAQEALGAGPEDFPTLAGLVEAIEGHGFEAGYAHVSSAHEWDDYEWSWTGSLVAWALREAPGDAERAEALAVARTHRREWIEGYRGELGFVTVVLHDAGRP